MQRLSKCPSILDGVLRKDFIKCVALDCPAGDESGIHGRAYPNGNKDNEEPQVSRQKSLLRLGHRRSLLWDEPNSLQPRLDRIDERHLEVVPGDIHRVDLLVKITHRFGQVGKPVTQLSLAGSGRLLPGFFKNLTCVF